MTARLVRFARRAAAWEDDLTTAELQQTEFRAPDGTADLRPSVYEVDESQAELVRAYSEHVVNIDPKREARGLSCTGLAPAVPTPGTVPFAFASSRHRELVLQDERALLALIGTLRSELAMRECKVTRDEVNAYISHKLSAADDEWTSAARAVNAKKWLVKLVPK